LEEVEALTVREQSLWAAFFAWERAAEDRRQRGGAHDLNTPAGRAMLKHATRGTRG